MHGPNRLRGVNLFVKAVLPDYKISEVVFVR